MKTERVLSEKQTRSINLFSEIRKLPSFNLNFWKLAAFLEIDYSIIYRAANGTTPLTGDNYLLIQKKIPNLNPNYLMDGGDIFLTQKATT